MDSYFHVDSPPLFSLIKSKIVTDYKLQQKLVLIQASHASFADFFQLLFQTNLALLMSTSEPNIERSIRQLVPMFQCVAPRKPRAGADKRPFLRCHAEVS
jgi:hypothetical protein